MKRLWIIVLGVLFLAGCGSPLIEGGKIHYRDGRYDQAQTLFRQAAEEDPNSAEAHFWLGLASVQRQDYQLAAQSFDRAFAQDSSYLKRARQDENYRVLCWAGYAGAGSQLTDQGDYAKAILWLERALELVPEQPQTYPTLARAYVALERYEDLLRTANQLLKLNPKSPEAHTLRALYFTHQATPDSAIAEYELSVELYKGRLEDRRTGLAKILGLEAQAVEELSLKLIELHRAGDEGLENFIADSLKVSQEGRLQVRHIVDNLATDADQLGRCYTQLGITALQMDSTAQAEGYLERSLAVNPSDYDAAYNLAVAKYRLGKLSDALKLFEAASEVFPDDEWLWIYIAEVKLGLKDYAGAIAAGERALEINPENGDAYRVMGYAYREQGNVEKATEMLRRWLEKSKKEE